MSEFLDFGFGEDIGNYLSFGIEIAEWVVEIVITEEGAVRVHYPKLYHCPRCGTNAPLGKRFYAVENIFDADTLEVKCATCWDRPTINTIKKSRR